ncbi:MAG: methyltransferase [Candidatus Woesearchaeota archaeon]
MSSDKHTETRARDAERVKNPLTYNINKYTEMSLLPPEKITLENICGSIKEPPVCFWAPKRREIQRMVNAAKAVHEGQGKPRIIDLGCGNAFLTYLLASTGDAELIGIEPNREMIENTPYSHPSMKLETGDSSHAVERYSGQNIDMVLCSWMGYKTNLTPDIRAIRPRAIIYVREGGGATGISDYEYSWMLEDEGYDIDDIRTQNLPEKLKRENMVSFTPDREHSDAFEWTGPALGEIKNLLRGEMAYDHNMNVVEIQIRKDITVPDIMDIKEGEGCVAEKYRWEARLEDLTGPLEEVRCLKS